MDPIALAPELEIQQWINTDRPLSLGALRGRVVMAVAFQMLCPGCVEHCLPQAKRVREAFPEDDLAVIGLHTVFEHHAAMTEVSLRAFLADIVSTFRLGLICPQIKGPCPGP